MDASDVLETPQPPARRLPVAAFALDVVIATAAMFGLSLAGGVLWGVYRAILLARAGQPVDIARIGQPGGSVVLLIAVVGTGSAALLTYWWRRRASAAERADSAHRARHAATWGWAALTGTAVFAVSTTLQFVGHRAGIQAVPTNAAILQDSIAHTPWLSWLVAVALAPAYEELLFRRVLFGRFWAAGYPVLGAVLSAGLFALLHEIPGQGGNAPAATALLWTGYGVMGLAFAWVYRRTGTLWAPIAAHALNNLIACIALAIVGG